jgi:hypothetical protein
MPIKKKVVPSRKSAVSSCVELWRSRIGFGVAAGPTTDRQSLKELARVNHEGSCHLCIAHNGTPIGPSPSMFNGIRAILPDYISS